MQSSICWHPMLNRCFLMFPFLAFIKGNVFITSSISTVLLYSTKHLNTWIKPASTEPPPDDLSRNQSQPHFCPRCRSPVANALVGAHLCVNPCLRLSGSFSLWHLKAFTSSTAPDSWHAAETETDSKSIFTTYWRTGWNTRFHTREPQAANRTAGSILVKVFFSSCVWFRSRLFRWDRLIWDISSCVGQDQSECSYAAMTRVDSTPALQSGLFIRDLAFKLMKSVNKVKKKLAERKLPLKEESCRVDLKIHGSGEGCVDAKTRLRWISELPSACSPSFDEDVSPRPKGRKKRKSGRKRKRSAFTFNICLKPCKVCVKKSHFGSAARSPSRSLSPPRKKKKKKKKSSKKSKRHR